MKSQHHGLAQCLLSKEIATKWHSESQEVKSDYEKKAEIIKAEHAIKYPDYKYSPKRRKAAAASKDGQNELVEPGSPLRKSKRKESSSPTGPKSTASRGRKRKASGPADEQAAKDEDKPSENVDCKADLSHLGALDADLFGSLPQLMIGEQAAQSQRPFATPSVVGPSPVDLRLDQGFSHSAYGGLAQHHPLVNPQDLHFLPRQDLMPAAQLQSEWLDFSQLDPQLQYDNPLTALSGSSTSDWTTSPDLGGPSLPNSALPVLSSSTNLHQPASPNPMDFGFFPASDHLDFNRLDDDWININPQNPFHGSFLGQPLESSTFPSFNSTHQNLCGESFLA
ncbi:hypothetical protein PTTG_00444 [Puccinia triticina 1-1 BBBD Race 1]|uniref:HMG box domain-containing protein n=2 Tax=Puccinia triticina TaxID=208348 RepID=A0A0C4EI78_PUCT1|nr:hypothetical protein PTTG_00444 [Puccinia triticina 1-1 BBBD Race 1]